MRKFELITLCFCLLLMSCQREKNSSEESIKDNLRTNNMHISAERGLVNLGPDKLSDFGFFSGKIRELKPTEGVIPYDLNTPLFSDYAQKSRFISFPEGKSASYDSLETLDFPVGTTLIKNFFYSDVAGADFSTKIIETRLLIKEEADWKALSYIWNDEQTEAFLEVAGGTVDIEWTHSDGQIKNVAYTIPNLNQCKNCHAYNQKMRPIGPTARQLNKKFAYVAGEENQLAFLVRSGYLENLPANQDIPKSAQWDDPASGSLEARAKAYLDINCGSCHRPEGTANTSGLFLYAHEKMDSRYGIRKTPVAAGKGSGGHQYDILPGYPEKSILLYRMTSQNPGIMMPEIGRKLVHEEGVQLIEEWILSL